MHLLSCLLAIYVYSFVVWKGCSFKIFVSLSFCYWIVRVPYVFWILIICQIYVLQIYSPSLCLALSFWWEDIFILRKSSSSGFCFVCFCDLCKTSLSISGCEDILLFSFRSFVILAFIIRSMIHLKCMWYESPVFFPPPVAPTLFVESIWVLPLNCLVILWKINWPYM